MAGHYPFGEAWYEQNTTTKRLFTSYENDTESGLDYALARYYDPRIASFCSADPQEGYPEDPQSWNRYTYVQNDPVDLMDPSGKGFFNWLVDIMLAVMDVLTLGTMTPFAIGGFVATAGVADMTSYSMTLPYGAGLGGIQVAGPPPENTPPQQPTGNSGKVYCDPSVMTAMRDAWRAQQPANMIAPNSKEAGFPVYRTAAGGYQPGDIQTGSPKGFDINVGTQTPNSVFHTHPPGTSGLPSTPKNNAGGNPNGDTGNAVASQTDIYVISDKGLSEAPASGPRNPTYNKQNSPWIVQGNGIDKWLPKLQKKCGQ